MKLKTLAAALTFLAVAPAAASADIHNIAIATKSSAFQSVFDVQGGSSAAGAKVVQSLPNGAATQRWSLIGATWGYQVVNARSGLCLTTNGLVGSQLYVTYCNSANPRQVWQGLPAFTSQPSRVVGDGGQIGSSAFPTTFAGGAYHPGQVAAVQGGQRQPGTPIVSVPGNLTVLEPAQQFAYWFWG